jgi:hypothetical protein
MSAKHFLFGGVILLAIYTARVAGHAQTAAAPNLDQCKKDAAAWYSKDADREYDARRTEFLNHGVPNPTEWSRISAHEVYVRMTEFQTCMKTYPAMDDEFRKYAYRYYGLLADRSIDYLTRHGELEQFMKEDAQGLR